MKTMKNLKFFNRLSLLLLTVVLFAFSQKAHAVCYISEPNDVVPLDEDTYGLEREQLENAQASLRFFISRTYNVLLENRNNCIVSPNDANFFHFSIGLAQNINRIVLGKIGEDQLRNADDRQLVFKNPSSQRFNLIIGGLADYVMQDWRAANDGNADNFSTVNQALVPYTDNYVNFVEDALVNGVGNQNLLILDGQTHFAENEAPLVIHEDHDVRNNFIYFRNTVLLTNGVPYRHFADQNILNAGAFYVCSGNFREDQYLANPPWEQKPEDGWTWCESSQIDNDGDGYCEDIEGCEDGSEAGDCNDNRSSNGQEQSPGTSEICDDNIDNDCDGAKDADDEDCQGPVSEDNCNDGIDNDGDGLVDGNDMDCREQGGECENGLDDDNDGLVDCADPDCQASRNDICGAEICNDNIDNDGDGLVDGNDMDCREQGGECENGLDDDNDGLVDCADPDCQASRNDICGAEICNNNRDDDNDGRVDCFDVDCRGSIFCLEVGEEACSDGEDNDGDGAIDCNDSSCSTRDVCPEICDNGEDDDADGNVDCADVECRNDDSCAGIPDSEVGLCDDQIDNDLDGLLDCNDADCANDDACRGPQEICDDGIDNDGDNAIDICDPECPGDRRGCPDFEDPEQTCDDNFDNDFDGAVDCNDIDCANDPICQGGEICNNNRDDDNDGQIDCNDADCANSQFCNDIEDDCNNGIDDDNDGRIDCADLDCDGVQAGPNNEVCEVDTEMTCNDNFDNDGDGLIDCQDADCADAPECAGQEACNNGIDDDNNGLVDCADPACVDLDICEDVDGDGSPKTEDCDDNDPLRSPEFTEDLFSENPNGVATCQDGIDNDCDGSFDAAESNGDCERPPLNNCDEIPTITSDYIDNCASPSRGDVPQNEFTPGAPFQVEGSGCQLNPQGSSQQASVALLFLGLIGLLAVLRKRGERI